jgi:hypothetical protein
VQKAESRESLKETRNRDSPKPQLVEKIGKSESKEEDKENK